MRTEKHVLAMETLCSTYPTLCSVQLSIETVGTKQALKGDWRGVPSQVETQIGTRPSPRQIGSRTTGIASAALSGSICVSINVVSVLFLRAAKVAPAALDPTGMEQDRVPI